MSSNPLALGYVGQQINMVPATLISRTAGADGIKAGDAVSIGSADHLCVVSESASKFLGIAMNDADKNATVRIMTEGAIVVKTDGAVAAGAVPSFAFSGKKWDDAAFSNTDNLVLLGSAYDTATSGAGLAIIRMQSAAYQSAS